MPRVMTVLFALDDEDEATTESLAAEIQAAYDTGGFFSGNFLVIDSTDDDSDFWTRWDAGVKARKNA